jgi:hypothetical protein
MKQSVAEHPTKPAEPHYALKPPKIVQTPTPKTDAAVQIASKMMNVSPDKILSKLAGKHVNLPDLERKDSELSNNEPDTRLTGPLVRGHSALGLEYPADDLRGYIQHVKVAHDYGANVQKPNSFTISSTEMDSGGTTAEGNPQTQEVLFMANGPGKTSIPPTTHEDYVTKHGNVVPGQPQTDGIYATSNGHPVYKLNVPIVAGHNYTKWVHELPGVGVNYGVTDNTSGKSDNWTDYTAKYLEPVKHISTFDEWHTFSPLNTPTDVGPTANRFDIETTQPLQVIKPDGTLAEVSASPVVHGHVRDDEMHSVFEHEGVIPHNDNIPYWTEVSGGNIWIPGVTGPPLNPPTTSPFVNPNGGGWYGYWDEYSSSSRIPKTKLSRLSNNSIHPTSVSHDKHILQHQQHVLDLEHDPDFVSIGGSWCRKEDVSEVDGVLYCTLPHGKHDEWEPLHGHSIGSYGPIPSPNRYENTRQIPNPDISPEAPHSTNPDSISPPNQRVAPMRTADI